MKNLLRIGALSFALLVSVFMLNHANAATGQLKLQVTPGTPSCIYGTSLDLGTHLVQFAAFNMTGNFTGSNSTTTWSCTDMTGLASWVMNINTTNLTNTTSDVISGTNIYMKTDANTVTAGSCTAGTAQLSTLATIATDKAIVQKTAALGDICTISAANVILAVAVPANQAVGLYTGTLTITLPSGF